MYKIMVDGQEVYSPALSNDLEHQILSPSLQLEIDTAGSLSFTLPPGHAEYDSFHKLKSVVTMEWDGVEIFRGRVLEEKTDAYNQKEIYCEGDLSLLLDSVQRPFKHESITKRAFIEQAIASHNEQVEEYKRFTLGDFSALTDDVAIPLESDGYADTLSAIRAVLELNEGYLFARYENGTRYLDFLTTHSANGQAIEFGVNLVDLDNQTAAGELCTVLLPIGGMLEDGTTVTIASVNGGKDTIEDAEAIAQYGRIVKTYAFDDITDPAELLKLAQEKLASMAVSETLILKAVDMHLLDESKGIILPGIPVLIHTKPHGFDNQQKLCTALDLDPDNPEDATYTFGKPEKTQSGAAALIASKVEKHTRTVEKLYKHYTETDYKVNIHAGLLDGHDKYISEVFIELDGINETIGSVAGNVTRIDGRVSSIEGSTLWLNRNSITGVVGKMSVGADGNVYIQEGSGLKIYKNGAAYGVYDEDNLTAGLLVQKLNGSTTAKIKADRIDLQGYVTAAELEANVIKVVESAELAYVEATTISAYTFDGVNAGFTGNVEVGSLSIDGATAATQDWTKSWLQNSGYITNGALAGYATQAWVENKGYVTETALAAKGYATQDWVGKQGYLVSSDYFDLQNWVASQGYATQRWVTGTALTPYATQAWVMANFASKS